MKIYSFYLIFSLFLIIKCIKESDFKIIENPDKTYFKIDSNKEIYLLYNNPKKGGEISFEFENPNTYTIEVYIYTLFSKIKKEGDSYKDYDKILSLKRPIGIELLNYLNLEETNCLGDINYYYSSNILSIVNELEIRKLKLNEPWIIKNVLSKKELNGIFQGDINENYILSYVSDSENFNILITDINNTKIYENVLSKKLELKNSINNTYNIKIKSSSENKTNISLIIYKKNPNELKNSIPHL